MLRARHASPLLLLLVAAVTAAPANAAGVSRADAAAVERLARSLGPGTGLIVTDTRGRTLASVRSGTRRPLGSVTKLFTTSAALLGLTNPPRTAVELAGTVGPDGVLTGDVVLRGGGDAGLGDPGLTRLRDAVVAAGVRRVTGRVIGDGSLFDAATGGPATGLAFDPEFDGAVGALSYEHGRAAPGGPFQLDPAAAAAIRFDDLLEAAGVVLPNGPASGPVPARGPLAVVDGDLPGLLRAANTDSSAVTAETLGKLLAAQRTGQPGTTAAAATAIGQVVRARLHVRPTLADSAGFVAGSQATPRDVARLLRQMDRRAVFARSLASPGTGTLRGRRIPAGCRAKTGTLRSARATSLAGICRGRVFAVLSVGPSAERARRVQDSIASVLVVADSLMLSVRHRRRSPPPGRTRPPRWRRRAAGPRRRSGSWRVWRAGDGSRAKRRGFASPAARGACRTGGTWSPKTGRPDRAVGGGELRARLGAQVGSDLERRGERRLGRWVARALATYAQSR